MKKRRLLSLTISCCMALTPIAVKASGTQQGFDAWLDSFKSKARTQGISQQTLTEAFSDSRFVARAIELDRKQPESKITFADYRRRIVSADRINTGRMMMRRHRDILNRVSAAYGVQPQYIVALWGIETSYGRITGDFDVIDSLASLAYEGRRREFFSDELINALKIIQQNHISADDMKGSWAGAMGQSQFMPSSFLSYAVDFNGDGRKDIWHTQEDVFASAANYLSQSGWKGDERWGRRVDIPASFTESMVDRGNKKTLAEWSRLGVTLPNGQPIPVVAGMEAGLVAPDGLSGPVYLTYDNYDTIMKWNRSTYFATSVGLLADAIAAGAY